MKKILFSLHSGNVNGILKSCFSLVEYILRNKLAEVVVALPDERDGVELFKRIGVQFVIVYNESDLITKLKELSFSPDVVLRESFFSMDLKRLVLEFNSCYFIRVHDLLPFDEQTNDWFTKHKTARQYFEELKDQSMIFVSTLVKQYYMPLIEEYNINSSVCFPAIYEKDVTINNDKNQSDFHILQLGTVYARKGCMETLKAFNSFLHMSALHEKSKLTFVGDRRSSSSEIEYSDLLKSTIVKLGLENHVTVLPTSLEPFKIVGNYDLLTLHSRSECSPLVIFESLKLGKPVVSSNVGGISEILQNENLGKMFEFGDIEKQAEYFESYFLKKQQGQASEDEVKNIYLKFYASDLLNERMLKMLLESN
jgi:glycosyltransferase involved in cell wall biosynthesis